MVKEKENEKGTTYIHNGMCMDAGGSARRRHKSKHVCVYMQVAVEDVEINL